MSYFEMSPQKIASFAFFMFVLLQTPCFILPGFEGEPVPMSPLQLSVSWTMTNYDWSPELVRPWLVPGTWMREALVPYLRCLTVRSLSQCKKAQRELINFEALAPHMEADVGLKVFEHNIKLYANAILVGSGVVTIAGLLSAFVPVRLALLGFTLMLFGIVLEKRTPLPPFFFMAVLVAFSVFASDQQKREAKRLKQARTSIVKPSAVASEGAPSGTSTEVKKEQ